MNGESGYYMKVIYDKGYFKFELEDGENTYQGSSKSIIEAKEMFLKYISSKIDEEIGNVISSYYTIQKELKM